MSRRNGKLLTLKEFRDRLNKLSGKSKDNFIRTEVNNCGSKLLELTKRKTPVDTGALKATWKVSGARKYGDGWEVIMSNPMKYATFVEFGHHLKNGGYYPGRYMATKSINYIRTKMPKEINADIVLWFENTLTREEWLKNNHDK